jgi:GNAT superfamily N-acetyltransferase
MLTVRRVSTRRERREFIEFPLKLYRGDPYFVPPLYSDEKLIFKKRYVYSDTCDTVYFNAYRDGKMVGRISGIIQKAANKKNGERRVRFTRFDSENDPEVARALFDAVEKWAVDNGMDTVCGPLGFSDLEREGLLIEGFDQPQTFEEQYNYPYYADLIEGCGYAKEVDWVESQVRAPKDAESAEKLLQMADFIMKRYRLRMGRARSVNDFLRKYADGFFDILDRSYDQIYGTVPFTDAMKKQMISNFRLLIDLRFVNVILDEDGKVVAIGLCLPSISEAVRPSGGRLTPATILRVLRAKKHPKVVDFALIGVDPAYLNKGISAVVAAYAIRMLSDPSIDHAETNLNLEDNAAIRNLWRQRFDARENKRRRCYVKKLEA